MPPRYPWSICRLVWLAAGLLTAHSLSAQVPTQPRASAPIKPDSTPARTHTQSLEAGVLGSTSSDTPYWLQTNRFGVIPKSAPAGLLFASAESPYRRSKHTFRTRIDWGYGAQVVGQGLLNGASEVILAEGYLKARWGQFELWGGRRRQIVGFADSPLSSGSFIWSGNALPLPQVQLAVPEYAPIGFTKGWLALKGFFAHGWFGKGPYVQGSFLHQKAIFIRVGPPQGRLRFYGAFTHAAQWAGYAPFLAGDPTVTFGGQIANSFVAYMNVVVPLKTDALKDLDKFTTFDQNRVGDHRGSAEGMIEYRFSGGTLTHYQQHFYDLGRKLYNLRNIEDGLYGLRFTNNKPKQFIDDIVVELFNSGNQGVLQFGKSLGGEWENYFNNYQYPEGWSYRGRTLGTPFISQTADVRSDLPAAQFRGIGSDGQVVTGLYGINNNRVWALHTGIGGSLGSRWGYMTKLTYSKNYGLFRYHFPPNTNQFSGLLSITRTIAGQSGSTLILSVAHDQGTLFRSPRQTGAYLGWRKTWTSSRNVSKGIAPKRR